MENVYRYRVPRRVCIGVAIFAVAASAFIVWLAIPRGNLDNVTPFVAFLWLGFFFSVGAWFYYGRSITLTESALVETGPFKRVVSIPWSEVAQVAHFAREHETDVMAASGSRKITIGSGIDRYQAVNDAIRLKAGERYSVAKLRPEAARRRLVAAIAVPLAAFGVLLLVLFVPEDPWAGWPFYGRVTIVVVDTSGAVVPEATLSFFSKRTAHRRELRDLRFVAPGPLETRLPPTGYSVFVKSPNHGTHRGSVKVEAGRTHKLQFVLEPEKR